MKLGKMSTVDQIRRSMMTFGFYQEIEGSIIMKRVIINCKKRIVDSIRGRHTCKESAERIKICYRREHPVQNISYLSLVVPLAYYSSA